MTFNCRLLPTVCLNWQVAVQLRRLTSRLAMTAPPGFDAFQQLHNCRRFTPYLVTGSIPQLNTPSRDSRPPALYFCRNARDSGTY